MLRQVLVGAAVAGVAVAVPGTAQAAGDTSPSLTVSPRTAAAGSVVHVSGRCEPSTVGFAISSAFRHDAAHDFAGVGAAPFSTDAAGRFSVDATVPSSRHPGSYTVTARCGGGTLGIVVTLHVVARHVTTIPAGSGGEAAPGAPVQAWLYAAAGAGLLGAGALGLRRRTARA